MFIKTRYNGYNRHGEQSAAGWFLILMQPKWESLKYPHYSNVCKCGLKKDQHTQIERVPNCEQHGIIARLKQRAAGVEPSDADFIEAPAPGCKACEEWVAYSAHCHNFSPTSLNYPMRAIVRYVRMRQMGHWMMGSARIGSERVTLSGSYGSDGLPSTVSDAVYDAGTEVPTHLVEAWGKGGGWNSAGNEASQMREWALKNLCNKA